jgi:cytochrome c peroxidase
MKAGERLFFETRFSQHSFAQGGENLNSAIADAASSSAVNHAPRLMSCHTCHATAQTVGAGFSQRSAIPERADGRRTTPRNSPALTGTVMPGGSGLLHFDGEFASAESLTKNTFLGRNFGWLPEEGAAAQKHFARVIREDDGSDELARGYGQLSYAVLLRGTDKAIPATFRLPAEFRIDVATATDEEIVDASARLVATFLRSLQFSRDAGGRHNGSAYDAFLAANRLAQTPKPGESPHEYGRRLGDQIANLRAPRYVGIDSTPHSNSAAARTNSAHFGELELKGMRIFFRFAVGGAAQKGGAGNCAECHVAPHFSDFAFHNTGVAQEEYDATHGDGAFARLLIPDAATRKADPDSFLPPTPRRLKGSGVFLAPVSVAAPAQTDLGLWNVYGNPDLPESQPAIERLLDAEGRFSPDELLGRTIARFKTSTVRGVGSSAPYFHTGRAKTIEETVVFYQRMSDLAREGKLRNAPPEYFGVRLQDEDIEPLAAFLRALDEATPATK